MPIPTDPIWHQERERTMLARFAQVLDDPHFVVDTVDGPTATAETDRSVRAADRAVDVKRQMIAAGNFDRSLQNKLPTSGSMDVTLSGKRFGLMSRTLGQVRLVSVPPTEPLIRGESPLPLTKEQIERSLASHPPAMPGVPLTTVVFSSGGFAPDAIQAAQVKQTGRQLVLIECNDAGGWTIHAPSESMASFGLLDPEQDAEKSQRIRTEIESETVDLSQGGISAEKLATRLKLPLDTVEKEFETVASDSASGLAAKRFDGRLVLYRESSVIGADSAGGSDMPLMDKIRGFFGMKDPNAKKLAFLSERRVQIAQQQEKAQEEVSRLEQRETELKERFKADESPVIRKRITTQMLQLRKDIDRKMQMLQMLNQQANVVAAHLHSIEMIKQGQSVKLPDSESMSEDAEEAEKLLAQLQADSEMADELSTASVSSMSDEEQALFDELMKDSAPKEQAKEPAAKTGPAAATSEPAKTPSEPQKSPAEPAKRAAASSG
jgi:hypothetical protein